MLTLTRRFINPLTRRWAGALHSPFALVKHVGRRSGKPYETPVIIARMGNQFVFALTYGPGVDWYRNVVAAGSCELKWQGILHRLTDPKPIEPDTAIPLFFALGRPILRQRHAQFVDMQPVVDLPDSR